MQEINEINFTKYLQSKLNNKTFIHMMEILSFIFNFPAYFLIMVILLYNNFITSYQFILVHIGMFSSIMVKNIVKRIRPYKANAEVILLDRAKFDEYSFPSIHTYNAFILSFILDDNLYYIPYMVGFSRIFLGVHYLTDVVGGYLFACIVLESSNWLSKY
jgi:membrane-associated phospholipid phosphatase